MPDRSARRAIPACSEPQLLIGRPVVWNVLVHGRRVIVDTARLAGRKFANGGGKPLILHVVRRTRERRHEAARHLVFALRAGLESLQFLLDAVIDALVVAGLEMQAVVVAARAPVAP